MAEADTAEGRSGPCLHCDELAAEAARLSAEVARLGAELARLRAERAELLRAGLARDFERPPHYL